jgi:hypothetical protein
MLKKFWKSVNIWLRNEQKHRGPLLTHSAVTSTARCINHIPMCNKNVHVTVAWDNKCLKGVSK